MDVADWLRTLGLERYEAAFRENGVSAEDLCHLTAEDLEGLGVTAIGHRRRLLVAIAKLNEQAGTDAASPVVEPAVAASGPLREDAVSHGGERRQLTVMFCDLVGSTALSEKLDPEELRSLLHAYRNHCDEVIGRYDGFVARYVGDGILTYFGWPAAHEDDAERAVRAALEIVHTVRQTSSTENLSVRIGIATGPVVVGEQAGTGDQSKLAVGSTPNLAARLQALATVSLDSVFDVATGGNWSRYVMFRDMFSSANLRREIFISVESAGLADRPTSMCAQNGGPRMLEQNLPERDSQPAISDGSKEY